MNSEKLQIYYQIWLFACLTLVAFMVVIGGYTRLTDSGLSIMEWRLFTGVLPPLTESGWQELFSLYQQIPQFKQINFSMDLEGFKQIFWLEYLHRLLGRVIGIVIIIPAIFFYRSSVYKKPALLYSALVLLQGCMGWFMVASGLQELVSVSHFRLAAHLILAFILFALMAVNLFEIKFPNFVLNQGIYERPILLKSFCIILLVQIIYGAFVAGLDAGLIYNSYPLMGKNIYPEEIFMVSFLELFFNNIATVQFIHRSLAFVLVIIAVILVRSGLLKTNLGQALALLLFLQFLLGIATLITVVNMHLAVLHQLFALLLFTNAAILLAKFRGR